MFSAQCLHPAPFTAHVQTNRSLSAGPYRLSQTTFTSHAAVSGQSRASGRGRCSASASSEPELSAGAIALGLKAYEKENYNEAIGLFKQALTLPGSGLKQYRDKPAIASDGEKISAYYNIACCLSRTGNIHDGLLALLEALQMGYEDFDQLRQDPDLEALRADSKFEPLMSRFQKVNRQNILQSFVGNLRNPLKQ